MQEKADVLNEAGQLTGLQETKQEIFQSGHWRLVVHLWIVDPKTRQLLVQQRASKKGIFDDLWDVSVGGGVQAGESSATAIIRETGEELGLKINKVEIKLLGRFKVPKFIPERQQQMNEYSDTFLVFRKLDLSTLRLQPDEVADVRLIGLQDFKNEINNQLVYEHWVPHSAEYYNQAIDLILKNL